MTNLLSNLCEGNRTTMVLNSQCLHPYFCANTHSFTPMYTLVPVCTRTHSCQSGQCAGFSSQQLFQERYSRWDWLCVMTEQHPHIRKSQPLNPSCGTALVREWLPVLPAGPWGNASSSRAESRHGQQLPGNGAKRTDGSCTASS